MRRWQLRAAAFFGVVDKVLLFVANLALVVIVLTITYSVWMRYVMRSPVPWGEDITSTTFAWFIFISMAAVHNRRGHVGIDVLTSRLPPRLQKAVTIAGDIFLAVFCGYTAWLCTEQTIFSNTMAETPVLNIPLSVPFASLAIGFALMSVRSLGFALGVQPQSTEMPNFE